MRPPGNLLDATEQGKELSTLLWSLQSTAQAAEYNAASLLVLSTKCTEEKFEEVKIEALIRGNVKKLNKKSKPEERTKLAAELDQSVQNIKKLEVIMEFLKQAQRHNSKAEVQDSATPKDPEDSATPKDPEDSATTKPQDESTDEGTDDEEEKSLEFWSEKVGSFQTDVVVESEVVDQYSTDFPEDLEPNTLIETLSGVCNGAWWSSVPGNYIRVLIGNADILTHKEAFQSARWLLTSDTKNLARFMELAKQSESSFLLGLETLASKGLDKKVNYAPFYKYEVSAGVVL